MGVVSLLSCFYSVDKHTYEKNENVLLTAYYILFMFKILFRFDKKLKKANWARCLYSMIA